MQHEEIVLVYDGECPICNYYCKNVRIQAKLGELRILNARDESETMRRITDQGFDIDQGMVLKQGEQYFYGTDAIHALALISSRKGIFNRLNYRFFSSKTLSDFLYPLFRSFRNLLLKMLGKTKINNLDKGGNDKF